MGGACLVGFLGLISSSTTEAECVVVAEAIKELLFLRHLTCFVLHCMGMRCVPVFEHDQGGVQLAQNPVKESN